MNRICRLGFYLLTAAMIALTTLGVQRLLMVPRVYDSVHQMGERLGAVLPQGYNIHTVFIDQRVTLHPNRTMLERQLSDDDYRAGQIHLRTRSQALAGFDFRVSILISFVYLGSVLLIWLTSRRGEQRDPLRRSRAGVFLAWLGLGGTVCVLCAGLFTAMRIVWTGVDQAFTRRSIIQIPGSKSVHIDGDMLLAMSSAELALMLVGMALTAFPLLVIIDACIARGGAPGRPILERIPRLSLKSPFSREHALRWAGAWYVLITLMLWTAPWSITMAQLLWRGA